MMDAAYFVGRREILDWINTTLELNVTKVEETCTGAVACQLMDCIMPGTIAMSKVNWAAKDEYAMICNYKILQSGFGKAKVSKPVEVSKLVRGKYQDNLEFMQWFKAFFDSQAPVDGDGQGGTRGLHCHFSTWESFEPDHHESPTTSHGPDGRKNTQRGEMTFRKLSPTYDE